MLHVDLGLRKLGDVVNDTLPPPFNYTRAQMAERQRITKGIILAHCVEFYQEQVIELDDPIEILNRLEKLKRDEINETSASLREKLEKIRYTINSETIYDFDVKFDNLIRDIEFITGEKLTEKYKRDTYYKAIVKSVPSIKEVTYVDRARGVGDLSLIHISEPTRPY